MFILFAVVFIAIYVIYGNGSPQMKRFDKLLGIGIVIFLIVGVVGLFAWIYSSNNKVPNRVVCDAKGTMGSNNTCYCPNNYTYETGKGCVDATLF